MDPAIGRFLGVDPIADQFAWVSPFNYAEDSPVRYIDLWGLQKYYWENGHFDRQVGDDTSVRILKPSPFHEYRDSELKENSIPAYTLNAKNEEAVMAGWAELNNAREYEHGMVTYSHEIYGSDGNSEGIVFVVGETVTDNDEGSVNLVASKAKIGDYVLKGWKMQAGIHNHPNYNAYGFSEAQPGGRFGNEMVGDYAGMVKYGIDIYLTANGHSSLLRCKIGDFYNEVRNSYKSKGWTYRGEKLGGDAINKYAHRFGVTVELKYIHLNVKR